jgi:hypothetical protein
MKLSKLTEAVRLKHSLDTVDRLVTRLQASQSCLNVYIAGCDVDQELHSAVFELVLRYMLVKRVAITEALAAIGVENA